MQKKEDSTHIGRFALSIPTVTCVMRHLVRHVLAETELVWVDADLGEEEEDPCHEVAECLISNESLVSTKEIRRYLEMFK